LIVSVILGPGFGSGLDVVERGTLVAIGLPALLPVLGLDGVERGGGEEEEDEEEKEEVRER